MTDIPDEVLDWDLGWWDYTVYCQFRSPRESPDRRCRSGVRAWSETCGADLGPLGSLRELAEQLSAHLQEAHPDA